MRFWGFQESASGPKYPQVLKFPLALRASSKKNKCRRFSVASGPCSVHIRLFWGVPLSQPPWELEQKAATSSSTLQTRRLRDQCKETPSGMDHEWRAGKKTEFQRVKRVGLNPNILGTEASGGTKTERPVLFLLLQNSFTLSWWR